MPRPVRLAVQIGIALAATAPAAADPPPRRVVDTGPATAPSPPPPVATPLDRLARARANLAALLDGRLAIQELAPQELEDVLELDRRLRGHVPDPRTPAERCVEEEVSRNGGDPSRLAWAGIELKCRELGERSPP